MNAKQQQNCNSTHSRQFHARENGVDVSLPAVFHHQSNKQELELLLSVEFPPPTLALFFVLFFLGGGSVLKSAGGDAKEPKGTMTQLGGGPGGTRITEFLNASVHGGMCASRPAT